jgi:cathepsin L
MLRTTFVAALCVSVAARGPRAAELTVSYSYDAYLKDFHKNGSAEGRALFETRLTAILAHNADPLKTYTRSVNAFTDEAKLPLGRSPTLPRPAAPVADPRVLARLADPSELPGRVDWRDVGVVSEVKNQGHCGSCWAFATTATVESHVALATGELYSLSPQQLVACSDNSGHCGGQGGCRGSVPQLAMDTIIEMGGWAEEWSNPYVSYMGLTDGACKGLVASSNPGKAGITGYETLPANNASAVMAALAAVGPLAINVDASSWGSYEAGIFGGCSYTDMDINHVVVLVGYGTDEDSGLDYWLVRNSWSASWGEAGYIRLMRDPVEATPCGVDPTPLDGTGCEGGPEAQYPCGQCGAVFDVSYPTGAFSF